MIYGEKLYRILKFDRYQGTPDSFFGLYVMHPTMILGKFYNVYGTPNYCIPDISEYSHPKIKPSAHVSLSKSRLIISNVTHPYISLLIHSFTHSLIHSFTHSLIHSFIHSFIQLFIHSFIHNFNSTFRTSTSVFKFCHLSPNAKLVPRIRSVNPREV